MNTMTPGNWYSSFGISTNYELEGPGFIPFSATFFLLHRVQTDSGVHPASYTMGTEGSFPGGKAAGA
jgi:hypothetical protein